MIYLTAAKSVLGAGTWVKIIVSSGGGRFESVLEDSRKGEVCINKHSWLKRTDGMNNHSWLERTGGMSNHSWGVRIGSIKKHF